VRSEWHYQLTPVILDSPKKPMLPASLRSHGNLVLSSLGLLLAALPACSESPSEPAPGAGGTGGAMGGSGGASGASAGSGGSAGSSGTGPSGDGLLGTFTVALNPAVDGSSAFTSVFGVVYSGAYPTDVIETAIGSEGGCTTYQFSRHSCISPACTAAQKCAGPNDCRATPDLVSVGTVTVAGLGAAPLTLAAINNNYQYPADIEYPGFTEGAALSLSATGGFHPAFTVTTTGVAPVVLLGTSFELASGMPLRIEWEPGGNPDATVSVSLNISRHGGSAGYLECKVGDTGSLTIPAVPITRLIELGVAGFPQLTLTRTSRAEASVPGGKIALQSTAVVIPNLTVEGLCSCFDSGDCGACEDSTKTVCDSVRKTCHAP
jgi:hypothetical protein